ncbi:glutamine amidotransferase class-I domain-containing protein [Phthorimaea operculella]|nr:glutamine amidotransferase class-I domain-containing protein [Phthorimaea operculella]
MPSHSSLLLIIRRAWCSTSPTGCSSAPSRAPAGQGQSPTSFHLIMPSHSSLPADHTQGVVQFIRAWCSTSPTGCSSAPSRAPAGQGQSQTSFHLIMPSHSSLPADHTQGVVQYLTDRLQLSTVPRPGRAWCSTSPTGCSSAPSRAPAGQGQSQTSFHLIMPSHSSLPADHTQGVVQYLTDRLQLSTVPRPGRAWCSTSPGQGQSPTSFHLIMPSHSSLPADHTQGVVQVRVSHQHPSISSCHLTHHCLLIIRRAWCSTSPGQGQSPTSFHLIMPSHSSLPADHTQGVVQYLTDRLQLSTVPRPGRFMQKWRNLARRVDNLRKEVNIALVGKYTKLEDSYASVTKALQHACIAAGSKLNLTYIEAENLEKQTKINDPVGYHRAWQDLCKSDGVIIPGGFGHRGMEGKIEACQWCRETQKPMLGICLGLQAAVIEFARNVLGLKGANTTEVDPNCEDKLVIDMPEHHPGNLGGTMRLGKRNTLLEPSVISKWNCGDKLVIDMPEHHPGNLGGTMRLGKRKTLLEPSVISKY